MWGCWAVIFCESNPNAVCRPGPIREGTYVCVGGHCWEIRSNAGICLNLVVEASRSGNAHGTQRQLSSLSTPEQQVWQHPSRSCPP